MFRFVAWRWNPSSEQSCALASVLSDRLTSSSVRWIRAYSGPGISVVSIGLRPPAWNLYSLRAGGGIVFGTLFRRNGSCAGPTVHGMRTLVDDCWGRYVAIEHDAGSNSVRILRDPVGGLPCYTATLDGVLLVFSYLEDVLDFLAPTINWKFVVERVCCPSRGKWNNETGLNEISEVRPGECLSVSTGGSVVREMKWQAGTFATARPLESRADVVERLRETTRLCVRAWASRFPRLLHRLSGGLDSSIVLGCLRSLPALPGITCVNYRGANVDEGDERKYARLMAATSGAELREIAESARTTLAPVLDAPRFSRPMDYQSAVRRDAIESQLAQQANASAIFSGIGGDQLFYQGPVILAVSDLFLRGGFSSAFLGFVINVAREQRLSAWRVLRHALAECGIGSRHLATANSRRPPVALVASDALASERAKIVDMLDGAAAVAAPGKRTHMKVAGLSPNPYSALGDTAHPEPVPALLSQPLIELCLRIPTYVLAAQGISRGLARQAFADAIPGEIAGRVSKGCSDSHLEQLLEANLPFIREVMLDGRLVREGILDKQKIERALSPACATSGRHAGEFICRHLNTEAWLHGW